MLVTSLRGLTCSPALPSPSCRRLRLGSYRALTASVAMRIDCSCWSLCCFSARCWACLVLARMRARMSLGEEAMMSVSFLISARQKFFLLLNSSTSPTTRLSSALFSSRSRNTSLRSSSPTRSASSACLPPFFFFFSSSRTTRILAASLVFTVTYTSFSSPSSSACTPQNSPSNNRWMLVLPSTSPTHLPSTSLSPLLRWALAKSRKEILALFLISLKVSLFSRSSSREGLSWSVLAGSSWLREGEGSRSDWFDLCELIFTGPVLLFILLLLFTIQSSFAVALQAGQLAQVEPPR